MGRMQVTRDADRVKRSVALSVLAYLLLIHLYGKDEQVQSHFSIFKLKQKFVVYVFKEQIQRNNLRWQNKLDKLQVAA
ncbi:MAG: hypothetical protein AB1489_20650 [Acidobacteriota bacterium]